MPGMQFEYDEHGGTFYYFLLSFIALILIPATYYFWPRKSSKGEYHNAKFSHANSLCCASVVVVLTLPCAYLVWPCLEVNPHDKA